MHNQTGTCRIAAPRPRRSRASAYSLPPLLLLAALAFPSSSLAQSYQEWNQLRAQCGLPSTLVYNDWVAQGSPCNQGNSATSGGAAPALPTAQQQAAMQVGMLGATMLGQGLHQLLYGKPEDPEVQQRRLAAQQLNNTGVWYLRQKKYADAIIEFQKALDKLPGDATIQRNLTLAKQELAQSSRDSAAASQTSSALGQLLGPSGVNPAAGAANDPASALRSLNLDSDPNVVDLRGTTKTAVDPAVVKNGGASGESLQSKQELDSAFDKALGGSDPPAPASLDPQELGAEFDKLYSQPPVVAPGAGEPVPPPAITPAPKQPASSPKPSAVAAPRG